MQDLAENRILRILAYFYVCLLVSGNNESLFCWNSLSQSNSYEFIYAYDRDLLHIRKEAVWIVPGSLPIVFDRLPKLATEHGNFCTARIYFRISGHDSFLSE